MSVVKLSAYTTFVVISSTQESYSSVALMPYRGAAKAVNYIVDVGYISVCLNDARKKPDSGRELANLHNLMKYPDQTLSETLL